MMKPHRCDGDPAEYYSKNLSVDDYYAKSEGRGIFHGKGAEDLGIAGEPVTEQAFCAFWDGKSPDGRQLVQLQKGKAHRGGWDCVYTLTKDASLAYARMSDAQRAEAHERLLAALKAELDYFEETYATSRAGKGGTERLKARLVFAI